MQPEHLQFGGGATETILHPLVAILVLIAVALILILPRSKAIAPFLLAFFTIPIGQVLVVGGLHITMHQILILAVLGRMAAHHGQSSEGRLPGGFNALDKVVVLWSLFSLLMFSLQIMEMQAFIRALATLIESLGGYLAARFLISGRDGVRRAIVLMAIICLIQGVCMISEQFTYRNVFAFLGAHDPTLREGHIRSEGVLGTLQGGTFAGVSIPLFLWLWTQEKSRLTSYAGIFGATAIALASHASTSWMAYGAGLLGLGFWPFRKQMRLVRWGLVATLIALHLVMHGPVWSLIEKVDLTGGSSSYHRYMLVDNCIRHFGDWWLIGYNNYGNWGFDMWDLCNQFVVAAVTGGVITLILFIAIYSKAFGAIGTARKAVEGNHLQEWLLWCLGASLFANCVASFGINYMVHLEMVLFPLLACISVAAFAARQVAIGQTHVDSKPLVPAATVSGSGHLWFRGIR